MEEKLKDVSVQCVAVENVTCMRQIRSAQLMDVRN